MFVAPSPLVTPPVWAPDWVRLAVTPASAMVAWVRAFPAAASATLQTPSSNFKNSTFVRVSFPSVPETVDALAVPVTV